MILYHATSLNNIESIKSKGLIPSLGLIGEGCEELNAKLGYIYLTEKLSVAKRFGFVVLEIDSNDLDSSKLSTYKEPICKYLGIDCFWNYKKTIPPNKIKFLN